MDNDLLPFGPMGGLLHGARSCAGTNRNKNLMLNALVVAKPLAAADWKSSLLPTK